MTGVMLSEIAEFLKTKVDNGAVLIKGVGDLSFARPCQLAFYYDFRYHHAATTTMAGAVITRANLTNQLPQTTVAVIVDEPQRALVDVINRFFPPEAERVDFGNSLVDPTAMIEQDVVLSISAIVGKKAIIGQGTRVAPSAIIGDNVTVGRNCNIGPMSVINNAVLGDRVEIGAGTIIGKSGFSFFRAQFLGKVPHIGKVIIQNDVSIGANCTIDRGAIFHTIIGEGSKLDNQVHVAHNVRIGRLCMIAAQAGIAGSAIIGDEVVIGGQAGIGGHVVIGDGAAIGGQAGVLNDVAKGGRVFGTPAEKFWMYFRKRHLLGKLRRS